MNSLNSEYRIRIAATWEYSIIYCLQLTDFTYNFEVSAVQIHLSVQFETQGYMTCNYGNTGKIISSLRLLSIVNKLVS
jgi:hypothetical protein